jgi:hypothetical protein
MPTLPDQGGVMPVLWQPTVQTSFADLEISSVALYTLNIISTQWIDKGVFLRFQVYNGQVYTYDDALANNGLIEFDLVVRTAIPPGTVCVVSMTNVSTQLYGYTGTAVYATGGKSVPSAFFQDHNSCLCFAFVPTAAGSWFPSRGQPMFAIGFNHAYIPYMGTGVQYDGIVIAPCAGDPVGTEITAPNFPDQYAILPFDTPNRWTFMYEVVYPIIVPSTVTGTRVCIPTVGIKYVPIVTSPLGSWSNTRDCITQPWTIVADNYLSVSNWTQYDARTAALSPIFTSDVGPFNLSAMAGQLVPVYWKPIYKIIGTPMEPVEPDSPLYNTSATLALLVTSPLSPHQILYFTNDEYDAINGGFGPRSSSTGSSTFVNTDPSFMWSVGTKYIDAGTVICISGIGTSLITIVNAHDTAADVGSITGNIIDGQAVTSLICMGVWSTFGNGSARAIFEAYFVCAALSDQYAGNVPPLSPCITISKRRFVGQVIYGMGRTFDNKDLPATVQAPLINSSTFTQLPWTTDVALTDLPAFTGMQRFTW